MTHIRQRVARRLLSKEEAIDKFMSLHAEIDMLLERIRTTHDDHYDVSPDDVNWGHVGTLQDVKHRLQMLSDMLHSEGEYAR